MIRKVLFSLLVMGTTVIAPSAMAQKLDDVNLDFPKSEPLKKTERFALNNLQKIGWFVVKDNLFIFNNLAATNKCCVAIDLKSGKQVGEFIEKGDVNNAIELMTMYGTDSLMTMNKKAVSTYSIKDLMADILKPNIINRKDTMIGILYTKIDGSTIMGAGSGRVNPEQKRYYKVAGDKCTQFIDMNLDHFNVIMANPDGLKCQAKAVDYYSLLVPNQKTGLVAMATRNGRILEVVNPKTMKVETSKIYNKATIYAEVHPSGKGMGKLYVVGSESFGALACDDDYIYVVMNEKCDEPKMVNYSLVVFDWKLNPVKKYDIMKGKEYLGFVFSADAKYLYQLEKGDSGYVLNQFAVK